MSPSHIYVRDAASSGSAAARRNRSGVNGRSRSRTPVASKTALRDRRRGRALRRLAAAQVRLRRAGRAARSRSRAPRRSAGSDSSSQSRLVTRVRSKLTCSFSVQLADWTRPPSSWLTRPTGSTICPASAAITARSSRIAAVASSTRDLDHDRGVGLLVLVAREGQAAAAPVAPRPRSLQPRALGRRLSTARARSSSRWRSRNSSGSTPAARASSSMNDSIANTFA